MTLEQKESLVAAGINYDIALQRFMNNETLFEHFLMKFPQDESYSRLCEAINTGSYEEGFHAAHTLKGLAGNLSFEVLYAVASELSELLRRKQLEPARALLPRANIAYDKIIQALSTI